MLVQQIVLFFGNLRACKNVIPFERELINSYDTWVLTLNKAPNHTNLETLPTNNGIPSGIVLHSKGRNYYHATDWLSIFFDRAVEISDEDTIHVSDKQRIWAELALVIGMHTGKTYLQVLFPSIKNQWMDPMLFDKLTNAACDSIMSTMLDDDPSQAYLVYASERLPRLNKSDWFDFSSPILFKDRLNLSTEANLHKKFAHTFVFLKTSGSLYYIGFDLSIYPVQTDFLQQTQFSDELSELIGSKSERRIESVILHQLIIKYGGSPRLGVIDYFFNVKNLQLYSVSSLVARVNRGLSFVIFDQFKSLKSRVLLLPELLSIWKKDRLRINCLDKVYPNPRKWLKSQVLNQWRNAAYAECPEPLLPQLIQLIDSYYDNRKTPGGLKVFQDRLLEWSEATLNFDSEDVYYLYGQLLGETGPEGESVLEVLLACLYYKEPAPAELESKIKRLANWLAKKDPSLICSSIELSNVYEPLGVGFFFGRDALILLLNRLKRTASVENITNINELLLLLRDKTVIDKEVFKKVRNIYYRRSLELGSNHHYTCSQTGANGDWIRGGRLFSGAGYCSSQSGYGVDDYYQLFFNNLLVTHDSIWGVPISHYGLNHYILGDGGNNDLINLYTCKQRYEATGVVYNCNASGAHRLSNNELVKIKNAHRRYKMLFYAENFVDPNQSLLLSTVLLIRDYVETGCHHEALLVGFEYPNNQLQAVWRYNQTFEQRYNQLALDNPKEFNRLNEHEIICPGYKTTVGAVLKSEDCIARRTFLLSSVVIKFTNLLFKPEIEYKSRIGQNTIALMRQNVRRQTVRDAQVIKQKVEVLCVSLMTHFFSDSSPKTQPKRPKSKWMNLFSDEYSDVSDDPISIFWDCTNKMNKISKVIFDLLIAAIKSGDFSQSHHTMANILEFFVKPHLQQIEVKIKASDITDIELEKTHSWLNTILAIFLLNKNEPLFDADEALFRNSTKLYDPICLLNTIMLFILELGYKNAHVVDFLDDLVRTLMQSEHELTKKIRINIKFVRMIEHLPHSERSLLVSRLNESLYIEKKDEEQVYTQFMVWRLKLETQGDLILEGRRLRGNSESKIDTIEPNFSLVFLIRILSRRFTGPNSAHVATNPRLDYLERLQSPIPQYVALKANTTFSDVLFSMRK